MKKFFAYSVAAGILLVAGIVEAAPVNFIAPTQVTAGSYTISSTGLYVFVDDITFPTGVGASAITITSDDVTLDLNGKKLIWGGTTQTTHGINITAPVRNIIIQNGTITGFPTTGVKIDTATSYTNIVLSDLTIIGRNLFPNGISLTNVFNGLIQRCTVMRQFIGGFFTTCNNIMLVDSSFSHGSSRGLVMSSCNNVLLNNCRMNGSVGDGAIGMNMTSCFAVTFKNCFFNQNISSGSSAGRGLNMNTSRSMSFYNCQFSGNQNSSTGDVLGISLFLSSGVFLKDCFCIGNRAASGVARGVDFQTAHGHILENCLAADNMSSGAGAAVGFNFDSTSTNNVLIGCQALRNASATGTSRGFSLVSSTTANVLKFCKAYDNSGGGANTGFFDGNAGLGSNMYYGCVASKNGTNFSSSIPFATWSYSGGTFATAVTNLPGSFYNVSIVA